MNEENNFKDIIDIIRSRNNKGRLTWTQKSFPSGYDVILIEHDNDVSVDLYLQVLIQEFSPNSTCTIIDIHLDRSIDFVIGFASGNEIDCLTAKTILIEHVEQITLS